MPPHRDPHSSPSHGNAATSQGLSSGDPPPRYPSHFEAISAGAAVVKVDALACSHLLASRSLATLVGDAFPGGACTLDAQGTAAEAARRAVELAATWGRVSLIVAADELLEIVEPLGHAVEQRAHIVVHVISRLKPAETGSPHAGFHLIAPLFDLGVGLACSSSAQEAADLTLALRRAAEDSQTPFVHWVSAPPDTERARIPDAAFVEKFFGPPPAHSRARPSDAPGWVPGLAKRHERSYTIRSRFALQSAMRGVAEATGHPLAPVHREVAGDSVDQIVAIGEAVPAARAAVKILQENGRRIGLVTVTALRPFFAEEIVKLMARAHAILVIEPFDVALAPSGPVALALKGAFVDALTWTPGFPGVGKIPPIVSATVATLEHPLTADDVLAAVQELEDGERARRTLVLGTSSDEFRPRPYHRPA